MCPPRKTCAHEVNEILPNAAGCGQRLVAGGSAADISDQRKGRPGARVRPAFEIRIVARVVADFSLDALQRFGARQFLFGSQDLEPAPGAPRRHIVTARPFLCDPSLLSSQAFSSFAPCHLLISSFCAIVFYYLFFSFFSFF